MSKESVPKTAFVIPDGHYEYLRMPFGLANAPAVFYRAINYILGSLRFDVAMSYIDDVLVTINKGMEYLKCVLETFRAAGMTLRLNNCSFFTI